MTVGAQLSVTILPVACIAKVQKENTLGIAMQEVLGWMKAPLGFAQSPPSPPMLSQKVFAGRVVADQLLKARSLAAKVAPS